MADIDFDFSNMTFDMDDDDLDDLISPDSFNITTTNLGEDEYEFNNNTDEEFKEAFYISYHGINPLVILKEDVEVLKSIIFSDPNRVMLKILLQNIEGNFALRRDDKVPVVAGFINAMEDKYKNSKWTDREHALAEQICNDFKSNWGKLRKIILDILASEANQVALSPMISHMIENTGTGKVKSVLDIAKFTGGKKKSYTATVKMLRDLMYNPNNKLVIYLRKSIEFYMKYNINDGVAMEKLYKGYNSRNYSYITNKVQSRSEIGVLEKLGFPTAIAGYESLIKPNSNPSGKSSIINRYRESFIQNTLFVPFVVTKDLLNRNIESDETPGKMEFLNY